MSGRAALYVALAFMAMFLGTAPLLQAARKHAPAHRSKHAPAKAPAPRAAKTTPTPARPAEPVEEVEMLDEPSPAAAPAAKGISPQPPSAAPAAATAKSDEPGNKPHSGLEWLSRMHPAVVHLPIAWVILLFLTDAAALLGGRRELSAAGQYLGAATLLSFVPGIVTGLLRFSYLPQEPGAVEPALFHRNIMYVAAGLIFSCVALRLWQRNDLQGRWVWVYMVQLTIATALIALGGHLGGALVYGDDFLPFLSCT